MSKYIQLSVQFKEALRNTVFTDMCLWHKNTILRHPG